MDEPSSFWPDNTRKSGGDVKTDSSSMKFFLPYLPRPPGAKDRMPLSLQRMPVTSMMLARAPRLPAGSISAKAGTAATQSNHSRLADPPLLQDQGHQLLGQDVERLWRRIDRLDEALLPEIEQGGGPEQALVARRQEQAVRRRARLAGPCGPSAAGTTTRSAGRRSGSPGRGRRRRGPVPASLWRRSRSSAAGRRPAPPAAAPRRRGNCARRTSRPACSRSSRASCSTLDRLSQKTSRFSPSVQQPDDLGRIGQRADVVELNLRASACSSVAGEMTCRCRRRARGKPRQASLPGCPPLPTARSAGCPGRPAAGCGRGPRAGASPGHRRRRHEARRSRPPGRS